MKSTTIVTFFLLGASALFAQTTVNKSIPVSPGQSIEMYFDYPNLIRVSTWDKNEVSVQGTVSINGGENDNAFELEASSSGSRVEVRNHIHDMKSLPRRITLERDGRTITFKTRADYERYRSENGNSYNIKTEGLDMQITLDIKVPKGYRTSVESVYGMVEVKDFNGSLKVEATYGGVDAAIAEKTIGELSAETNYGQIYSNLDVKFGGPTMREENFHTFVSAKPGTGPSYTFDSKYGNVYLRKPAVN
jgi:hypothetical protein